MQKQAVMIILEKDGTFLLGKRSAWKAKAPGYWCPISGHIDGTESEEEAVIREASEELGIRVRPVKKITTTPTHDGTTLLHWWKAEIISGNPVINNNENEEICWFSRQDLMNLFPVFKEDIAIILEE